MLTNYDVKTVEGFGEEWSHYDQSELDLKDLQQIFNSYFHIFPWSSLPSDAIGFDLGCGSGRWARLVAPRVGKLYCVDASPAALAITQQNLAGFDNCVFLNHSIEGLPFEDASLDFGYSLGVLHHVPDTQAGLKSCVNKLKPGAPFLVYLYYAFDNQPHWFRLIWKMADLVRQAICRLPFKVKKSITELIALGIYWPLARTALLLEKMGLEVKSFPLAFYRQHHFYVMRTDAMDRFGTRLEQRFTANEIRNMLEVAGLEQVHFSETAPYWCAVGYRKSS